MTSRHLQDKVYELESERDRLKAELREAEMDAMRETRKAEKLAAKKARSGR